jgi:hypothetical protein
MSEISLVQISDLHFDKDILNSEVERFSWACGGGYDGHDLILCYALKTALRDDIQVSKLKNCHLIVGGDLTSTGAATEFVNAKTYCRSEFVLDEDGTATRLGLTMPEDRCWMIPGNHDHWNGHWVYTRQRGYTKELFPDQFRPHPWVQPIQSGPLELVLCGVDSNSIFEDFWINVSFGADGGFSPDHREKFAAELEKAMLAPLPKGVKKRTAVILCHHPFTTDCRAGPLRLSCAKWLLQLAADWSIPLVLTGHTHHWWTESFPVRTTKGKRLTTVMEGRAPTAVQVERKFNPQDVRDPSRRRPGFWYHQIVLRDDLKIQWTAKLFLFSEGAFYWTPGHNWFSFTT